MISSNYRLVKQIENNHPSFLIIPFEKEDIFNNETICKKYSFDLKKKLQDRYPNKYITITSSGRKALKLILNHLNEKKKNDDVTILTTSGNKYISSCLTDTISNLKLNWNRKVNEETDIIIHNHEFGYVNNKITSIPKEINSNLIEDCAFSFASKYSDGNLCGNFAPYAIFSFPKFFPIQVGGFLISDEKIDNNEDDPNVINYINNVIGYYFENIEKWTQYRLELKKYYNEVFKQKNMNSYYEYNNNHIPGVFLFNINHDINLQELKEYYWKRGIQCSVFYGKNAFYLPLNQKIKRKHVDYFYELFLEFLNINNADYGS